MLLFAALANLRQDLSYNVFRAVLKYGVFILHLCLLELLTHFVAGLLFLLHFFPILTVLLGDGTYSSFLSLLLSLILWACMRLLSPLVLSSPVCLGHILMHNIPSIKLWLNAECARTWQLSG